MNLPFSLKGLGADGRLRKQEKGNGRGFLLPRGITPFRIVGYITATHMVYSTQARHDSVARSFYVLLRTALLGKVGESRKACRSIYNKVRELIYQLYPIKRQNT